MFAVVDLQGRVVAFSGRVLPDPTPEELGRARIEPLGPSADREAKYVNSPESPIYKKRETVFGLFQARAEVRQRESCVLVEGNFDVVGLHARGVRNVVAPLGTAFTSEQARLVKRFAPSVTFLFDGDRAGRAAVTKSREPCREAGLIAKVATLPEGIDPDELARKGGAEAVRGVIGSAQGMIEYLIGVAVHGIQAASDAQTRAQRIRELGQLIASEDDPAVRAMAEQYADGVVARLGISDARTFRALSELVRQAAAREPRPGETRTHGARTSAPGSNASGASSNSPSPASSAPGASSNSPSPASAARASTPPERALPAHSSRPFDPRRAPATGGARVTPMRARSRDRRDDIVLGVLGALLDFPELVEDSEVQAALGVLEDEAALAAVVIRRAWESAGPRGDRKDPRRFGEQVLANVEGSIQKFAGARLTAPERERLEDARAELLTNAEKLRAIELARHRSEVVEGLQRAQATGDHAQELELLEERQRMLQDRAKEFSRRLPQRDGDSWSSSNPFELPVGGGTRSES
jgi:DNA primase